MNVLYLIHRYGQTFGGAERYIYTIAQRMAAEGHSVTIYTSNVVDIEGFWKRGKRRVPAEDSSHKGVRVRCFQARVLPLHSYLCYLLSRVPWDAVGLALAPPGFVLPGLWRAVVSERGFGLVHAAAYPSLMYLGAIAAHRSGARLVLMPCTHPGTYGDDAQRRYFLSPRMVHLYNRADAVIALTNLERQTLIQAGVVAERVYVTGVGVDPKASQGADPARFRQAYGLSTATPVVAFIGHKTEGKGALHLLDACEQLLADRLNLVVAMLGERTDVFRQRYRKLPSEVRARVLDLVGLSEAEKHDLLAASSVLVLPSKDDSFGIVLLEAWLHRIPVIGARAGGVPDVIQDGVTGLLVPYGDKSALVRALSFLLDHPDEAAAMGQRGWDIARQRWTWEAVFARVSAIYERVIASRGAFLAAPAREPN